MLLVFWWLSTGNDPMSTEPEDIAKIVAPAKLASSRRIGTFDAAAASSP
jgi:hypothetical protein